MATALRQARAARAVRVLTKTYIVSHSSMDLVSTLNHYERCGGADGVHILISSTPANLQFLQSVGVSEHVLRFMRFDSRAAGERRGLRTLLRQLFAERCMLDELVAEICSDPDNELVFHSYDNDPHVAYLVSHVARCNRVTLIDTLGMRPQPLRLRALLRPAGVKNLLYLALLSWIFGRLFMLSGTPSYPLLSLDLARIRVVERPKSAGGTADTLLRYRYHIRARARTALVLYGDSFAADEERAARAYRDLVVALTALGFAITVKVHPQSDLPGFLQHPDFQQIPKYIPFELVDLTDVRLVVGLAGAALLCTASVRTLSLLPMVIEERCDRYRRAMLQLSENPAIEFVRSAEHLLQLLVSS
jgi:hypothetical protein